MLVLCHVAALLVTKRRVRLHDTVVAQVLERAEILLLLPLDSVDRRRAAVRALEPAAAEREGAEGLVDVREQLLGARRRRGRGRGRR